MSGVASRNLAANTRQLLSYARNDELYLYLDFLENCKDDVNINEIDAWRSTALSLSVDKNRPAVVQALLELGAKIWIEGPNGVIIDALHKAIRSRNEPMCVLLIKHWSNDANNVLLTDKYIGLSYIHRAIEKKLVDVVRLLIACMTRVEDLLIEDDDHRTPLKFARDSCKKHPLVLADLERIFEAALRTLGGISNGNAGSSGSNTASEGGSSSGGLSNATMPHIPPTGPLAQQPSVSNTRKRTREENASKEPPAKKSKGKAADVSGGGGSLDQPSSADMPEGGGSTGRPNVVLPDRAPAAVSAITTSRAQESANEERTGNNGKGKEPAAGRRESGDSSVDRSVDGSSGTAVVDERKSDISHANVIVYDVSDSETEPLTESGVVSRKGGAVKSEYAFVKERQMIPKSTTTDKNGGGGSSSSGERSVGENVTSVDGVPPATIMKLGELTWGIIQRERELEHCTKAKRDAGIARTLSMEAAEFLRPEIERRSEYVALVKERMDEARGLAEAAEDGDLLAKGRFQQFEKLHTDAVAELNNLKTHDEALIRAGEMLDKADQEITEKNNKIAAMKEELEALSK